MMSDSPVTMQSGSRESKHKNYSGKIVVYSILGCPHCIEAKKTLKNHHLPFVEVRLDLFPNIRDDFIKNSRNQNVPQIYFNEVLVGGSYDLKKLIADQSKFANLIEKVKNNEMPADSGVVIPDASTMVAEKDDPFLFQCEPDEYFVLMNELERDGVIKKTGNCCTAKKRVFTGKAFVDWVKEKEKEEATKAVEIGQALIDRKYIRATNGATFAANDKLYVLIEEDSGTALNNGPQRTCVSKTANEVGEQMRKMILQIHGKYLYSNGKYVDYKEIKTSAEFQCYKTLTRDLIRVNMEEATREEKLSFFINIYNALVIHAMVENGPPTNLWARYKLFNNNRYIIGSHKYNLQDIENGVLRSNRKGVGQLRKPFGKNDPRLPVMLEKNEPLIHFALVCGAKSCPPIKIYSAHNIDKELQLAAAAFLDNDDGCCLDLKKQHVILSTIFKWYHVDFGKDDKELLEFVMRHMKKGKKRDDLHGIIAGGHFEVSYFKYNWSVNERVKQRSRLGLHSLKGNEGVLLT